MNHEQFIRRQLEKNLVKGQSRARKLQREIITRCLLQYKLNDYYEIDDLLADATRRVKELSAIGRGTTVVKFATAMSISRTSARIHLLKLDRVIRNESNRPFIYTVGKA